MYKTKTRVGVARLYCVALIRFSISYYNYKKCLRWWIHSWRCDLGAVTNQVSWIETNLIKPNRNLVRTKKFNLIGPDHKDWIGLSPKQGVKPLNPTTMLLEAQHNQNTYNEPIITESWKSGQWCQDVGEHIWLCNSRRPLGGLGW